MQIRNISVFVGEGTHNTGSMDATKNKEQNKAIYAGNLNKVLDPIAQKRDKARAQAMKVVGDAWDADKKIDDDIKARYDRIGDYKKELKEANTELRWFADERETLRKAYGVEEDSREQLDLKLLEKRVDAKRGQVSLTKEESERLEEIDRAGLSEYQQRSMEMYEESRYYDDMKIAAERGIEAESRAISTIKQAKLKSQGMIKADAQAEKIMEEAGEEIIGMLMEEAKEHIDEEMEEEKEQAEKAEAKKEEQEERLEKAKEKKEQQEEITEQLSDVTEYMAEMDNSMGDIQKELKKITEEMKLLEEDLKGAAVDVQS